MRGGPLVALALAAAAAACGSDDADFGGAAGRHAGPAVAKPRYPYPPAAVEAFTRNCERTSDGEEPVCRCTIERLQRTLPYAEFASADRAIRAGREVAGATLTRFNEATSACRESG